jgi:hypothetical protein
MEKTHSMILSSILAVVNDHRVSIMTRQSGAVHKKYYEPDNRTRLKNNMTRLKIDISLVILRQTAEQYDVN